jgi:hypothetical protein
MIRNVVHACAAWESASTVEPVVEAIVCRTGIALGASTPPPRFCFVSVASPVEQLLGEETSILDRTGAEIAVAELASRLLAGEVAAVVTSGRHQRAATDVPLPTEFVERRAELRRANVLARFLLRQIGLEEVSSHRGAPARLYEDIAALWSTELSTFTDPAMLLPLGADRQRYVDVNYTERATDRLPRALGRLHDLGVQSYPRLVII